MIKICDLLRDYLRFQGGKYCFSARIGNLPQRKCTKEYKIKLNFGKSRSWNHNSATSSKAPVILICLLSYNRN